jgi:hypothetical protein
MRKIIGKVIQQLGQKIKASEERIAMSYRAAEIPGANLQNMGGAIATMNFALKVREAGSEGKQQLLGQSSPGSA